MHMDIISVIADVLLTILRDPIWQFVGAVIGAAGIGVAVFLSRRSTLAPVSAITLLLITNASLFHSDARIRGRLRIRFDDQDVDNLRLIRFRLTNTGEEPILPEQVYEPIRVTVSSDATDATIIDTEQITATTSLGLKPSQENSSTLLFPPVLMNPGDYWDGQLIVANGGNSIKASARIANINSIQIVDKTTPSYSYSYSKWTTVSILLTAITTIALIFAFQLNPLLGWVLAASAVGFALLGVDKWIVIQSLNGNMYARIPENIILLQALLGGSMGTLLASRVFNHKWRKQIFMIKLYIVLALQFALIVWWLIT